MQRRRIPEPWVDGCWALALVVASAVVAPLLGAGELLLLAPVVIVLCVLAGRLMSSLRFALVAFALGLVAAMTINAVRTPGNVLSALFTTLLIIFALCLFPWLLGRSWRLRLEQRQREQHAVADGARVRERTRIAQDMHDSLGHDLALIALRSGAMELAPEATEQQRAAAAELRTSAVAATDRLHQIVGVLRQDASSGDGQGEAEGIDELIDRSRNAGASVRLQRTPPARGQQDLSTVSAQTLFRVVQESITNAIKHAPGGDITVQIDEAADPIMIMVDNDLGASAERGAGSGQGLAGLDERLRLIGGTLQTVRQSDSFVVRAEIPRHGRIDPSRDAAAELRAPEPRLRAVRQTGRKRLLQTAVLPLALAAVLVGTLIALQAVTVIRTALSPDDYARIHTGQTRAQIAPLLPEHQQEGPPPILTVPPAPRGADCEFYQARSGVLDLSQDMFRLCFLDGVLVAKDHLR